MSETTQKEAERVRKTRKSFSLKYKLEAIAEAKKTSNRAAANKFGIDEKLVRDWRKSKDKLSEAFDSGDGKKKRLGLTSKPRFIELEENRKAWIEEKRNKCLRVSRTMIQQHALKMFQDLVMRNEQEPNSFKVSRRWIHRFFKRHNFCLHCRTSVCQKVPADLIPKLIKFVTYIRKIQIENKYPPSCIFAADETAVWYDMLSDSTVEHVGAKHVTVRSTGNEKTRLTVMLTATADGRKLKLFVILKRKCPLPDLEKMFPSLIIAYSENGWMDNGLTNQYLNKVIGAFSFTKRLLVWDAFRCHISNETKTILRQFNVQMAVIPGGCTGYIQAPNVCWNKTFKENIRECYDNWMESEDFEFTKSGNVKAAPLEMMCKWIKSSWESLSQELISKSFKACALNLATDGSEDNEISVFKPGQLCGDARQLLHETLNGLHADAPMEIDEVEDLLENETNMLTNKPEDNSNDEWELEL